MPKYDFYLLLCMCHILGDYYFQTESIAEKKNTCIRAFFCHIVLYSTVFVAVLLCLTGENTPNNVTRLISICALLHCGIDCLKVVVATRLKQQQHILYISDQIAHFASLWFVASSWDIRAPSDIQSFLPYCLYFLCLLKPANITFKQLFGKYQVGTNSTLVDENNANISIPGAGALIGNLERVLCAIFILLGEFSAIGLTMTAKSIARYEKISQNAAFAEYYLIGTLYSMLYTILLYWVIFAAHK